MANLLVRGCGLLVALAPAILMIVSILKPEHERTELFIVSMLGLAFFGIPGLYVAFKGRATGESVSENRKLGLWYIGGGLVCIAIGAGVLFASYAISFLVGFVVVWHGIVGFGAVLISLGLLSVISGRNLVADLSKAGF